MILKQMIQTSTQPIQIDAANEAIRDTQDFTSFTIFNAHNKFPNLIIEEIKLLAEPVILYGFETLRRTYQAVLLDEMTKLGIKVIVPITNQDDVSPAAHARTLKYKEKSNINKIK